MLTFIFLLFGNTNAQPVANYVSNGGFEKFVNCNGSNPYLSNAKDWNEIDQIQAAAYCNYCLNNIPINGFGFQYPRSGSAYVFSDFFILNNQTLAPRTYFRNHLKNNLIHNKTYCVKFYVNIGNNSTCGMDGIGAYFGDNSLDTINYGHLRLTYLNPQIKNPNFNIISDTLNWIPVNGTFVATGQEKYMVIGNFKSDSATNFNMIATSGLTVTEIYVDDVSCIPIDLEAYAGPDKNCIVGDSVFIGRTPDVEIDESCVWYKLNANGTLSAPIQTVAGLYVKPTYTNSSQTETFVVRQQLWCSGVKWDTVLIHRDFVGIPNVSSSVVENDIGFFPNPASNKITFEYKDELRIQSISIKNILGQQVFQLIEPKKEIDVSLLPTGLYYLRLETNKGSKTFKLKKE